ncbi:MAG: sigma-E factor negative regulatory protein [Janthinobacterium lividum]
MTTSPASVGKQVNEMKYTQESVREQISAFADGNLQGEDLSRTASAVALDDASRSTWGTYHLIGDVLRSGAHAPCSDTSMFMARFRQRLAAEASLVAAPAEPAMPLVVVRQPVTARPVKVVPAVAANEPVFRWKLVAGAASLAAVAAIGWNLVGFGAADTSAGSLQAARQQSQRQVAQASGDVIPMLMTSQAESLAAANGRLEATRVQGSNGEPRVMLRDARLDVLLEAHRQAGGASQMPSGFLRNATFDGPSR